MVVDEPDVAHSVQDSEGVVYAADRQTQQHTVVKHTCIGVDELVVAVDVFY